MNTKECDVVIIGAGPAGVTLAGLLAESGVRSIIIDREPDVIQEPRAVGIDDEALRTLQAFGMAEPVLNNAVRNAPIRYYDSRRKLLAHVAPSAQPYGWPRRNLFFQPNMEEVLRDHLATRDEVELIALCEAVDLQQDETGVVVRARRGDETLEIRAAFAIGADGGKSFVRRAIGVEMEGKTAPMKWLVVDIAPDTWDAPYSAVFSSPKRPAMTLPLPFGYRRFEFKILDNEDPEAMAEPDAVAKLLAPYYPHAKVPPAVRRRVYWHHSRTAETFQVGRVFLVGDAAHLQPPFFGQGMNSGMRDVTNLAWKLAMVCKGHANLSLLATYDSERRGNAKAMVEFATGVGRLYQPRSRFTEIVRNALFRGAQRVPGGREYILQMKYKPIPRYRDGFVVAPSRPDKQSLVGRAFPQPLVQRLDGTRQRLDDALGDRIAVLGVVPGVAEAVAPELAADLVARGGVIIQSHVMPTYRREGQFDPESRVPTAARVEDIYDFAGGLRDLQLARPQDEVYIIRPDRYVAATCSREELNGVLARLFTQLRDGDAASWRS